jgi:hypothetical protein
VLSSVCSITMLAWLVWPVDLLDYLDVAAAHLHPAELRVSTSGNTIALRWQALQNEGVVPHVS